MSSTTTTSTAVDVAVFRATTDFKMNIGFSDLCYAPQMKRKCTKSAGKDQKEIAILKGICGEFKSGRLTAIIGPSGAGKTTLLNILSGIRTAGVTGQITINQEPINRTVFRKNTAFITQESALLAHLTTMETLRFAAKLKLPTSVSEREKDDIVDNIVRLLGLQKCAQNYVHHLSGGEKKRLAIAVELITNPAVMFFDEPTSGLDSVSSAQVIKHLRELAHDGRTIICVIHQPSSSLFQLFDDLYILSNGSCIYNGPLETVVDTFERAGFNCPSYYNPADYAIEVASMQHRDGSIDQLIANSRRPITVNAVVSNGGSQDPERQALLTPYPILSEVSSTSSQLQEPPTHQSYPISVWRQTLILTHRSSLCTIRDLLFAQLRVIAHIIVGFLLGAVFYNVGNDASKVITNLSCLFFFLLFIFYANAMPTVLTFPLETSIFFNQCCLNHWYSLKAYYMSKVIADLPLLIICPLLFILPAYFLTGQPIESDRMLGLMLVLTLTVITAHSLGLFMGAAVGVQLGVFLLPAATIPMLIFSGFFIRFNELQSYFQPLTYISNFRYGVEGVVRIIYGNNRTELECSDIFCYYKDVDKFLEHMDMTQDTYMMDILGLTTWIILLQIALYVVLKWKISRQQ